MTSEPPHSDHGGSGHGGYVRRAVVRRSAIAPVRALVVLVLFVVAAMALVAVGTRPPVSGDAATPPSTTSTTAPAAQDAAHHDHHDRPAQLGHRGGGQCHRDERAGGALLDRPDRAGVGHARRRRTRPPPRRPPAVYYAAGQQESAASIATTLGLKPTAVVPLTTAVPVTGVSGDDVVVVVGSDLRPGCRPDPAPAVGALPEILLPFARGPRPQRALPRLRRHPGRHRGRPGRRPARGRVSPALLARLAARFALVAVISGRPADFLHDVLASPAGRHARRPVRPGPRGSRRPALGAGDRRRRGPGPGRGARRASTSSRRASR